MFCHGNYYFIFNSFFLEGCPSDWEDGQSFGLGCYKFFDTEKRNWNDAQKLCEINGGHLVKINNNEQIDALRAEAMRFQKEKGKRCSHFTRTHGIRPAGPACFL